jgi:hypothetical protein
VVGSDAVYHASRDRRTGTAPSYRSKGYPCSRVPIVALEPTSGEVTSLQVGPKPDWLLACHFRALADVVTANPPSVMPRATSVPAVDGYVAPTPRRFCWAAREVSHCRRLS